MTKGKKMNKDNKKRWLFFAWSYSRRSEDIAAIKGIEYFYFPISQKIRFFQFPLLFAKSFFFLFKKRLQVVFIQHPPIHAILPVFLYSLFSGAQYVIDSHITPGTTLVEKPHHHFYLLLHRFYSYYATVTLFHSHAILERVKRWRCDYIVFENLVRELGSESHFPVQRRPAVGMISTFSPDEHILDVIEAAGELKNVSFYITGDKRKVDSKILSNTPENIFFTGYIKGSYYYEFLMAMDIVLVLTDRKESALQGAYEALSAETPLVLSDTETMRYFFPQGVIFVKNNKEGIREGIEKALREKGRLGKEIKQLKEIKLKKQKGNFLRIKNILV
ncbi:MAG: glycosyltransferase [Candidatus Cloacimonadota bacterium]|nr:MAG: glycosyltransferase [Candidatus Cloacimonadota bacterium]